MPFLRPGLSARRAQVMNDLMTAPGGDGMGLLRRAVSAALAWALGNLAHSHDEHLDWIARMSVPWSAEDEWLEAWASVPGVSRKAPTPFVGPWSSTGGVPGVPLPAGSSVARDDGAIYLTQADVVVAADGSIAAQVAAVVPGAAGTCQIGTVLTLSASVAGVSARGVVTGNGVAGTDAELDGPLRTRMLQRFASPPEGGAASDYLQWALAVPGVTRAWVLPLGMGAGTVVVYIMMDDARATQAPTTSGFPTGTNGVAAAETRDVPATGDQLAAANAVHSERPTTALVYWCAPTPYPVPITLHAAGEIPVGLRPQIETAIDGVFLAYSSALSLEIETDPFGAAIRAVPGMPPFTLVLSPILAPVGALPVRGVMTYA